ncbi:MAG: cobaltochelatase subunit CobT [Pseudomonadota bacterium]
MDKKKANESIQQAIFRALSKAPAMEVKHAPGPCQMEQGKVKLSNSTLYDQGAHPYAMMGEADQLAFKLRYHDKKVASKQKPSEATASEIFNALEEVRVEYMGARYLKGARRNIGEALECDARRRALHQKTKRDEQNFTDALKFMVREKLMSEPPPPSAKGVVDLWRDVIEEKLQPHLEQMRRHASKQKLWGEDSHALLRDFAVELGYDEASSEDEQTEKNDPNAQDDPQARDEADERGSDEANDEASGDVDEGDDQSAEGASETGMREDRQFEPSSDAGDDANEAGEGSRPEFGEGDPIVKPDYRVWTKAYDQEQDAAKMVEENPQELIDLRAQLDRQMEHLHHLSRRLATRLQRKLQAMQRRQWQFDLEEGILDTGRLARIVVNANHPLSYKIEKETEFKDTIVCLLIDNSGSMRGRPITIASLSADILAKTLEQCGVKVEMLGFTTSRWKGGLSRENWVEAGRPARPGRLNDLLHIIYKSADEPYRRAKGKIALMLREGLLKENIDGEAIEWAHKRLLARPEERRILMVVSDGAPVDDSTLSVNENNYLDQHLRKQIEKVENRSEVQLMAIGIGHDVTRYYRNAVTILDVEHLAGAMMSQLSELFEREKSKKPRRVLKH